MKPQVTRREMLRFLGIGSLAVAVAACQPKVIKETVVVEKEKVVEKPVEKVVEQTVVVEKEAALRTYIRSVQKRVGKAKAGWLAAARLVVAKFPAWIGKSGGEILGRVRDQSNQADNPSITMSNEVAYASQIFPASKLAQVLSSRVRDMEKCSKGCSGPSVDIHGEPIHFLSFSAIAFL